MPGQSPTPRIPEKLDAQSLQEFADDPALFGLMALFEEILIDQLESHDFTEVMTIHDRFLASLTESQRADFAAYVDSAFEESVRQIRVGFALGLIVGRDPIAALLSR